MIARSRRTGYPDLVRTRLRQRLATVAHSIGAEPVPQGGSDSEASARLLLAILTGAKRDGDASILWLAYVAISTTFPSTARMRELVSLFERTPVAMIAAWMLDAGIADGVRDGDLSLPLVVPVGAVVIDVSYSATNPHNSGIQRVVRSAAPHWSRDLAVVLAADLGSSGALRVLSRSEHARAVNWDGIGPEGGADATSLLAPWRSIVLFPEVPDAARLDGLTALAELSGNRTAAIGHDAIPLTGREWVSRREAEKFGRFLPLVRQLDLVIGVSMTAARDFQGISRSMAARGEQHPRVVASPLPLISRPIDQPVGACGVRPLVLVVGSREPRKNHDAVVFAAERLWRAGLDFELLLLGSWGWSTLGLRRWVRLAVKAGRPISVPPVSTDADLWAAYERAAFTVFPSFQEGFGLPIAESLSRGVPVITSAYGSMAEVARDGGCLTVDPRDDDALHEAMHRMLVEPGLSARLRAEALARPVDSWRRWADDVMGLVRAQ